MNQENALSLINGCRLYLYLCIVFKTITDTLVTVDLTGWSSKGGDIPSSRVEFPPIVLHV